MAVKTGNKATTDWNKMLQARIAEQARSGVKSSIFPSPQVYASAAARLPQQERINTQGAVAPETRSMQTQAPRVQQAVQQKAPATTQQKAESMPTVTTAPKAKVPKQTGPYSGTAPDNPWAKKYGNIDIASGDINGQNWYGDSTIGSAVRQLAGDPQQINYNWARAMGYGQGVEGLLNQYVDPYAMAMLQGLNPGLNTEYLDYVGGFNANAMKNVNDSVQFNPRSIVQRILGASGDMNLDPNVKGQKPDQVGQLLYGGPNATNPAGQVDATLKFLESSLTGLMGKVAMDSLLSMYAQQGREFLRFKMTEGGAPSSINFGGWLMDRLGPTGGL